MNPPFFPVNNPAGATRIKLKFGMETAADDWWWAMDNLAIGIPPFVSGISSDGVMFTARIVEALGKTVDTAKPVAVELNGTAVNGATITREEGRVVVAYSQAPTIFPPGSKQTVKITFTSNENKQVVETVDFTAPGYTTVNSTPQSVSATITDAAGLTVDENKPITLDIDGVVVTPTVVTRTGTSVSVSYSLGPNSFASNSDHSAKVTFSTGTNQQVTETVPFRVVYATLPASLGTALGSGTDQGLKWRTYIIETNRPGTSIAAAEKELLGEFGPNIADLTAADSEGYIPISTVNFDQGAADAGFFKLTAEAPLDVIDEAFPGSSGGDVDNLAADVRAFIEIPTAGFYTMGINSDDGFLLTAGPTNNPTQIELGKWDGSRGTAESRVDFKVDAPGVYSFRLLYFEGTGGANAEWYSINPDGTRALINGSQPGALSAFRQLTSGGTGGTITGISYTGGQVVITYTGTLATADQLTGNFVPVAGASSPYTVTPEGAQRFYKAN